MKVLFIGGTGNISTAVAKSAIARGIELTLLTRGERELTIDGVRTIRASITDERSVAQALTGQTFDAVVNWIAFAPADVERDIRLFRDKTSQYIFISSASVYQKPVRNHVITERTPLENPYWDYSRQKIACERILERANADSGFPMTIVRPSLTYGDTIIPLPTNSWYPYAFTVVDRLRRGKKVVIPGDGTALWVMTHNSDFAKGFIGLLGNPKAIGEAFQITSDEVLSWNQLYEAVAGAAGVEGKFVHIASDFIASCIPEKFGSLIGDKSNSVIFDNSKIKSFVPDFRATNSFAEGMRQTVAWFDSDPNRQLIDEAMNRKYDALIEAYETGLQNAVEAVATTGK